MGRVYSLPTYKYFKQVLKDVAAKEKAEIRGQACLDAHNHNCDVLVRIPAINKEASDAVRKD
jgi:hypothetical protein